MRQRSRRDGVAELSGRKKGGIREKELQAVQQSSSDPVGGYGKSCCRREVAGEEETEECGVATARAGTAGESADCRNTSLRPATVRRGAVFVAYAREKSLTHSTLFLVHLHRQFQEYVISVSGSGNQTDNGTEFTAPWNSRKVTGFTRVVETCLRATHHLIPPGDIPERCGEFPPVGGGGTVCRRILRQRAGVFEKGGVLPGSVQLHEAQ